MLSKKLLEINLKPLLILLRIVFVGLSWSIFFLEGIRVIMLKNWRFDIFRSEHWQHAWDLWVSGWIIDDPKEWAFVLIIITFIPLWLTGWAALSLVAWGKMFMGFFLFPLRILNRFVDKPVQMLANTVAVKSVKKKKSYKEIRPQSLRAPISESPSYTASPNLPKHSNVSGMPKKSAPNSKPSSKEEDNKQFDHSLFQFDDDDDDFDFDFDAYDKNDKDSKEDDNYKKAPDNSNNRDKKNNNNNNNNNNNKNKTNNDKKSVNQNQGQNPNSNQNRTQIPTNAQNNNKTSGGSSLDIIKQKGYEVLNGVTFKNNLIDFIGVANKQICICLIDKEPGDWLADEERFNDEEPLWFSESSHRISPVRKVDIARQILKEKLEEADLHFDISAYVINQIGNIINAEDMFETWNDMNISVTRIDRGTPKELRLFAKSLADALDKVDKEKFEKVKKIIRSIS